MEKVGQKEIEINSLFIKNFINKTEEDEKESTEDDVPTLVHFQIILTLPNHLQMKQKIKESQILNYSLLLLKIKIKITQRYLKLYIQKKEEDVKIKIILEKK